MQRKLNVVFNLGNYLYLLDDDVSDSYLQSIQVATISTLLCLLIGYPIYVGDCALIASDANCIADAGCVTELDVISDPRVCLDRYS